MGAQKGCYFVLVNRVNRETLRFLGQEVDNKTSNQLIRLMVYLGI